MRCSHRIAASCCVGRAVCVASACPHQPAGWGPGLLNGNLGLYCSLRAAPRASLPRMPPPACPAASCRIQRRRVLRHTRRQSHSKPLSHASRSRTLLHCLPVHPHPTSNTGSTSSLISQRPSLAAAKTCPSRASPPAPPATAPATSPARRPTAAPPAAARGGRSRRCRRRWERSSRWRPARRAAGAGRWWSRAASAAARGGLSRPRRSPSRSPQVCARVLAYVLVCGCLGGVDGVGVGVVCRGQCWFAGLRGRDSGRGYSRHC